MIKAELFTYGDTYIAMIGGEFYRWRPIHKKWIRSFWLSDHIYERAKLHGRLFTGTVKTSQIVL